MNETWLVLWVNAAGFSTKARGDLNFKILHLGIATFALMPHTALWDLMSEIDAPRTQHPALCLSFLWGRTMAMILLVCLFVCLQNPLQPDDSEELSFMNYSVSYWQGWQHQGPGDCHLCSLHQVHTLRCWNPPSSNFHSAVGRTMVSPGCSQWEGKIAA